MCLVIKTLPKSQRHSNCVPCFKLYETGWKGQPHTPFQYFPIPQSGILSIKSPTKKRGLDDRIENRAIHAYSSKGKRLAWCLQAKAYAFGVMAYGPNDDLCCALLYIPELDKSPDAQKRINQIKKWMKRDIGPSNREVKALFPQFVAPTP